MKTALKVILLLLIIAVAVGLYLWNKPHRDYQGEDATYQLESAVLMDEYISDEEAANARYLDQVILVKGVVTEKNEQSILLDDNIYASMEEAAELADLSEGDEISVKGRLTGYDELMGEIKLDHCSVIR